MSHSVTLNRIWFIYFLSIRSLRYHSNHFHNPRFYFVIKSIPTQSDSRNSNMILKAVSMVISSVDWLNHQFGMLLNLNGNVVSSLIKNFDLSSWSFIPINGDIILFLEREREGGKIWSNLTNLINWWPWIGSKPNKQNSEITPTSLILLE